MAIYVLLKDLALGGAENEIAGTTSLFDNTFVITMEGVRAKQKKLVLYGRLYNAFTTLFVNKRHPEITYRKHY